MSIGKTHEEAGQVDEGDVLLSSCDEGEAGEPRWGCLRQVMDDFETRSLRSLT